MFIQDTGLCISRILIPVCAGGSLGHGLSPI